MKSLPDPYWVYWIHWSLQRLWLLWAYFYVLETVPRNWRFTGVTDPCNGFQWNPYPILIGSTGFTGPCSVYDFSERTSTFLRQFPETEDLLGSLIPVMASNEILTRSTGFTGPWGVYWILNLFDVLETSSRQLGFTGITGPCAGFQWSPYRDQWIQ